MCINLTTIFKLIKVGYKKNRKINHLQIYK